MSLMMIGGCEDGEEEEEGEEEGEEGEEGKTFVSRKKDS
jgi:hypothetical protein